jgi:endonuclease III
VNSTDNPHPFVREITEALQTRFGSPDLGNKQDPFDELLFIVLSSKTPPDRYQQVYERLREQYPDPESLATAHWEDVAATISKAGLHNRKARAIVQIAQRTKHDFNQVTLAPLKQLSNEEGEQYLTSLPEVSQKTAKCVLMYSLGREVFPADNHCLRIAYRLGWLIEQPAFSRKIADHLEKGIPASLRKPLHIGMVQLGRYVCTPRNPACTECPILHYCPIGKQLIASLQN